MDMNMTMVLLPPPVGSNIEKLSIGYHSCALYKSGALSCWGYNDDGQTTAPVSAFSDVAVGEWIYLWDQSL